jgi:phosphonate transport system substrate-binding protein
MSPNTRRARHFFVAAALLPFALAGCGASAASGSSAAGRDPGTLHIAQIPSENATEQAKANKALFALIEKETGKKVETVTVTSYAAVIESQRAGKSDVAFYGPDSYVAGVKSGLKVTPAGISVDTPGGKASYQSYAVVPADSPIKTLADFKGKTVCFVDPNSTSGHLYPVAGLQKAGLDPEKDLKAIYAGGHDASVLSVLKGDCDAGFAYDTMVDKLLPKQGKLKPGQLRIVWKSDAIPNSPVAISNDLTPALKDKLVDLFQHKANADYMAAQGLCTGLEDCMPGGGWGYIPTTDSTFDIIRHVCTSAKEESCAG